MGRGGGIWEVSVVAPQVTSFRGKNVGRFVFLLYLG